MLVSIPGLTATILEICYLLLPSRDMAEISLKQRKSPINQPTIWQDLLHLVYKYYFFSIRIVIYKVSNFTWNDLRQKPIRIKAVKIDKFLGVMVVN